MEQKIEIWKPVPVSGFEKFYEVSNMGRIRALERVVSNNGGVMTVHSKIKKTTPNKYGYYCVGLWANGKGKFCFVHRLVAQAFIPNPDNLPCINHRDERPENNRVDNLEWCTHKYNNNYGTRNNRVREKMINGKNSIPIYQFTIDGKFVKEWPSIHEINRVLGFNCGLISNCCNHKPHHHTAYGFIWRYADEVDKEKGAA